mmetsp:Transcript_45707/g.95924  ORF Transcript_45707/g.95924 Transcript_45707/m.95924 type:complete len:229 (+) Transcript_45707:246-932(+)
MITEIHQNPPQIMLVNFQYGAYQDDGIKRIGGCCGGDILMYTIECIARGLGAHQHSPLINVEWTKGLGARVMIRTKHMDQRMALCLGQGNLVIGGVYLGLGFRAFVFIIRPDHLQIETASIPNGTPVFNLARRTEPPALHRAEIFALVIIHQIHNFEKAALLGNKIVRERTPFCPDWILGPVGTFGLLLGTAFDAVLHAIGIFINGGIERVDLFVHATVAAIDLGVLD